MANEEVRYNLGDAVMPVRLPRKRSQLVPKERIHPTQARSPHLGPPGVRGSLVCARLATGDEGDEGGGLLIGQEPRQHHHEADLRFVARVTEDPGKLAVAGEGREGPPSTSP
jgi:hypothetical protein